MALLFVAAGLWLAVHLGVAGTRLRGPVARVLGETGFRAVFSTLAVVTFLLLAHAWTAAKGPELWFAPQWLRVLLIPVMLPAFILLMGGFALDPAQSPRGMARITRHPLLWSLTIWAAVHVLGTGDLASVVFFGTFAVTALAGMCSIDAKRARRDSDGWPVWSATTSILPFRAIRQGRNRFVPSEIGWATVGAAIAAWVAILWLHPLLFGVRVLL